MKHLRTTAILIGLAAYLVAFFAMPMPSFPNDAGVVPSRARLFGVFLLCPDKMLFPYWFGTPARFELADRAPILFAAITILAWAFLLGWLLLMAFRINRGLTRLEISVFATVVGLNVLSTWTLLMGLLAHLDRTSLITFPALLTLAVAAIFYWRQRSVGNSRQPTIPAAQPSDSVPLLRRSRADGPSLPSPIASRKPMPDNCDPITPRWLWLGLPFVLAILLAAMLPPLDFDVCEYHLQAPKEFLQQGRITFLPHNVYANMPLGAEMLSLLGMVFAGDWWWGALLGKTVIATFTPLCALGIFAAGRRVYSTGAGVVAALVYISIPWIVGVSSSGLVEGVAACYLFLALYAVVLSNESQKTADLAANQLHSTSFVVLAGYLAGGAVATKYPAILFVLAPLTVWTFVAQYRRVRDSGFRVQGSEVRNQERGVRGQERGRSASQSPNTEPQTLNPEPSLSRPFAAAFRAMLVFLLAATVGCGLWLGKNAVFTDNPTYPLLYEVFDGKTWNADKDRQWNQAHRAQAFSPELLMDSVSDVTMTNQLRSPLVLPLVILAFFTTAASRQLRWSLLAYVIFYFSAWWLLTHRIDRFWLPVLPVLALLAGVGAYWTADVRWRRTLAALLLIGLAWNFLLSTGGMANAWFVPLEQLRDSPPLWITPWHWYLNNDSGRGAVLTVGDAAVFDLKEPVLYNTCFDDCIFKQLVKDKTAEEIRAELASRHIVYVYVNWSEIARYRDTYGFTDFVQPQVFDRLVKQGILEQVQSSTETSGRLYRVTPQQ